MTLDLEEVLVKSNEVKRAMNISLPIVALESTVLTHGLPRPQNLQLAHDMERTIREQGATPATVGFLDGYLHVGLTDRTLRSGQHARSVATEAPPLPRRL